MGQSVESPKDYNHWCQSSSLKLGKVFYNAIYWSTNGYMKYSLERIHLPSFLSLERWTVKSRELFVPCTKIRHIPSIICVVVCILLSGLPTVHRQQMPKYRNKSEQYDNNSPSHFFQEVCISSSNHKHYVTYKIEGLQIIQILDQRRVESTTWMNIVLLLTFIITTALKCCWGTLGRHSVCIRLLTIQCTKITIEIQE